MDARLEHDIDSAYPEGLTFQKTIPTFHPESPDEAADIFARATSAKQKIFIAGFGNNIDPVGEPFADLLVVKSDRLNSIIDIGDRDFYITVGSGYPLKEINHVLAEHNLWFPFADTNYPGSFGGALAAGLSGSDGHHAVPLSRHLLSVTAVLPDSSIVTPGALTFKSVSGYDISRIFFNSWGTLGFLTQLSFRALPLSKKAESPQIKLTNPDKNAFAVDMSSDSPLSHLCRKIKAEFDPDTILPIITV